MPGPNSWRRCGSGGRRCSPTARRTHGPWPIWKDCAAPRKNCWQLAAVQGDADPYGFQHLLGRATWSPAAAQAALSAYVMDHLGAAQGVLIVDETGFLKKGRHSAGVARQYSGTAGRIENCQIGVFLAYAGPRGATLLDWALYLPRSWTEAQGQVYVLAVTGNEHVWVGCRQVQVQDLVAELPAEAWQPRACGLGAKGPRVHDWQCLTLAESAGQPRRRNLLCRRSREDPARPQACPAGLCAADPGAGGGHALVHRKRLRGHQGGGGAG